MVMFIEGLPYATFPDKMKAWMAQLMEVDDGILRKLGLTLMGLGLLIVYLGRR
jgi:uncharacterized protein YjeT (DUF2065 family)